MPHLKIWIHLVWSTKNREPHLKKDIRYTIFNHIKENAQEKNIYIDFINGYTDHVHCLISLGNDQNISKITQLIKGESSFWVNKNNLINSRFEWQDEYFAVSVSHSHINRVRDYIKNQESHHEKNTLKQEYDDFILKYDFQKYKDEK